MNFEQGSETRRNNNNKIDNLIMGTVAMEDTDLA